MLLSLVLPCYNEEKVIEKTHESLSLLLDCWIRKEIITSYELIYVDDGSIDKTFGTLLEYASTTKNVKVISLSANFGHQAALTAGLQYAKGDAVVTLDADLQDPPEVIEDMIQRFKEGYEVVYGVRKARKHDTVLKRLTAQGYYKLMKAMGVDLIYNHADFRLISRRVLQCFKRYNEVNRFLRGIFPIIGFRQCIVEYDRQERAGGETKYPARKMFALAIEGVTSFTSYPLRIAAILGAVVFALSASLGTWVLVMKILGHAISGWASIALSIYAFGGIQLMFLGLIGEYIGRIYKEVKRRPIFIVRETLNFEE